MRLKVFIGAMLFGLTLAIYWPARHFGMIYLDDVEFLNPDASIGLNRHGMAWAMTAVVEANWHPATLFSFLLTRHFFGLNPGPEHLVNVFFHAANAVLLFLVLVKLTECGMRKGKWGLSSGDLKSQTMESERRGESQRLVTSSPTKNIWLCAFVAAIFAWHPLRVESVAWIAERKDVLFTFFMFLALWCYAGYAIEMRNAECGMQKGERKRRGIYYGLALGFFVLSFMSKAMVVTLPFLLLLLDFWPLGRFQNAEWGMENVEPRVPSPHPDPLPSHPMGAERGQLSKEHRLRAKTGSTTVLRLFVEKIPFFALALVFCVVTFHMQRAGGAVATLQEIGMAGRLENATLSYVHYLGKFFWPANLAIIYPFPKSFDVVEVALCGLLLLAISALCVTQILKRPYLAVGWFWYLGMMVPVIGLVDVGGLAMADRYSYVPLIGPVMSLVWLVSEWAGTMRSRTLITAAAGGAFLAICIVLTRIQLMFWQDNLALFGHAAEISQPNAMTQMALATGLAQKGRLKESAVHYQIAAKLVPGDYLPHYYLAIYLRDNGFERQALTEYAAAASDGCNPNNFFADVNLADALTRLGRYGEAVSYLEAALRVNPNSTRAMNNLAWTLATCPEAGVRDGARAVELGEHACALTHYKQTIFIGTLAAAYAESGRFDEAIDTAQQAIALAKQHGETALLQNNENLLAVFQEHKAYHEPKFAPDQK